MIEPVKEVRLEPRWPVVLTIVAVALLLAVLPGRIALFPAWVPYLLGGALLVPIAAVRLTGGNARWLRGERAVHLLFVVVAGVGTVANLANLINAMVRRSGEVGGLQLLASSIAVWVTNILAFSLLYWQIDRGGPEARANEAGRRPDWLFPQGGAGGDAPPGWRPAFVDYLFLGYTTATAFSPTDVLPLTSRAKMMMMIESTISLATLAVVAARAINILGS